MAASSKAAGGRGSDGMVGVCETLINVVTDDRRKLLKRLNQNGKRLVNSLIPWVTRDTLAAGGKERPNPSMAV